MEQRIVALRRRRGLSPARIAGIVNRPSSTVPAVLVRHHLNRLDHLDRVTRAPIRRYEMSRPGELVHVDVKKLGRIPEGGGWRIPGRAARGRQSKKRVPIGYVFIHAAVDAYTRLAYAEALPDEQGATAAAFWPRAAAFFASHGITVKRVLTDNGSCYRSRHWAAALGPVAHSPTQPYRPATNGKASVKTSGGAALASV